MRKFENTVSIPDRLVQTWLTVPENIFDTLAAIPKDMKTVIKHTSDEIKNIFKSAITKWKRYQKIWNTILSPFVALWTAVEWAVRTVVTPAVNLAVNTLKSWGNTIDNTRKSTLWSVFSDKPTSNFEYWELKTANIINKNRNWISKWRFNRKIFKNTEWKDSSKLWKETNDKEEIKNVEHRWVEEAKRILSDSPCWKTIIDGLCAKHNDFGIIFKDNTSDGSCNADHTITIWTQMPDWITGKAPFNWEANNSNFQKKHLLLHELSHCAVHSHSRDIPEIQEWLNLIKQYIEDRKDIDWRTLSILSYRNNTYRTTQEKAKEDFVEMLALRMNWNWNLCKKYLKLLSDNEHKGFRESHWLTTITREDASKLQSIFDRIIHYYGC